MVIYMEQSLLKIFKLADLLNEKQNNVYAEINYSADATQKLQIFIRSKKDFSFVHKCQIDLADNILVNWDNVVTLFENYIHGGLANE